MHPLDRRRGPVLVAAAIALLLAALVAAPALAKEGVEAALDAPIARDTPGGRELLVGMMVTFPEDGIARPVTGSPIYLKLKGPGGASTRVLGREDGTPGHYTMRIQVPPGGVASLEVGYSGTTDLAIAVTGTPLVAGAPGPGTAALAPAATAPALAAPGSAVAMAPATAPATATASPLEGIAGVVLLLAAGLALAAAATLATRGGRAGRLVRRARHAERGA